MSKAPVASSMPNSGSHLLCQTVKKAKMFVCFTGDRLIVSYNEYHPTPPVELVLSIVTDNEPIPNETYKHLSFLLLTQSGHRLRLLECYQ